MKITIVILALAAVAAAVPQQRGIIDDVEQLVNKAIDKAQSDLDQITGLVTDLTSKVKTEAENIIAAAKSQIASAIDSAEDAVANVIIKGLSFALCAKGSIDDLNNLKSTFTKNTEDCAGSLSSSIETFESTVTTDISDLKSSISELAVIIDECGTSPLKAITCAIGKIATVETLVSSVISDSKSAVEEAEQKATTTIDQVKSCAQKTVGDATIVINKIITTVKQCS